MNLIQMLEEAARRFGENSAIVHGERRISYHDLDEDSGRFAGVLASLRITKGDRVAILLSNSPDFVIVYFGIIKLGAVAVLLDPKYKPSELACLFDNSRPRVLVSETACLYSLTPLLNELPYIERVINLGPEIYGCSINYSELMAAVLPRKISITIKDDDLAHIAYTSGPSFNPRGAMVPHSNLVREIQISAGSFQQSSEDVVALFALPMHHVIGLVVVMLTSLYCGSLVIILNGVSIDNLASAIERHKITLFIGVPFIHAMVLRKHEEGIRHKLMSLRVCASGGDILPVSLVEKYWKLLNIRLINFYGLTESIGHVTCEPLQGPLKKGSVGPALSGWCIRIVDTESCALPANHQGEVVIRGTVMAGYYNKMEATREVLRDNWLHTGDIGKLDEDGYLYITGLQKDMLICKGQNIFPTDIEHVLSRHPAVAQAAVVGVPDEMRGEVVGAAIVLRTGAHATENTLKKLCLEHLANYKVPKYFVFWEKLPLTDDNRVDKATIKLYFAHQAHLNTPQDLINKPGLLPPSPSSLD